MLSNHLILCCPLLLPSVFLSTRVFSNNSDLCIRWPKYWSFSFNISSSSEYSEFISFRVDWFDLLAVQQTLKSLLQHNSKASILWCSAFFTVHLSHLYMTTGSLRSTSHTCTRRLVLYGPPLTPVHDDWKTHRFDMETASVCQPTDVSAF